MLRYIYGKIPNYPNPFHELEYSICFNIHTLPVKLFHFRIHAGVKAPPILHFSFGLHILFFTLWCIADIKESYI